MIKSNISYIQNRIQYNEYRINELSGVFDNKIADIISEEEKLI